MADRSTKTRKVAVALPSMESAADSWMRNIRLSGFAVIILGLIVLSIVVLAPSLRTLVDQRQQIAALEAEVAQQQGDVTDLENELDRWSDPAYIEAQARERIYYVYPGEFSYLVIDPGDADSTTDDGAPISDEIQTTQVDWMSSLMSSVLTAGLTDATPEQLTESPE
jgi:cell division protein FtsB